MKKGQAAMEFLMTYGWAILVVLAAIGALAYFGVLSPSKLVPDKCTLQPKGWCLSSWSPIGTVTVFPGVVLPGVLPTSLSLRDSLTRRQLCR
jgi:hypothetical protein